MRRWRWRIASDRAIMSRMLLRLAIALAVLGGSFAVAGSVAGGASNSASIRDRAVRWAESQNGLREQGKTNCGPQISRWQRQMGLRLPPCRVWCGAYVHQAYLRAGIRLSERLIDPDRSYSDALAGQRGLRRIAISKIQRGDIVFYKFRRNVRASHFALARGRPSGGMLSTAEGNVSHAVSLERRGTKYIVLAARVTGDV